jgi:hypothetical protein
MREWSQLRWFEIPALVTLRSRCCPGAITDLPTVSAACPGFPEAVNALATAAVSGADLDEPVRAYRKVVSCLSNTGDSASFGQDGAMTGGEDTTFRAFVAHLHK